MAAANLPKYLQDSLMPGTQFAKTQTPGDTVASTAPVSAPWRTPAGSNLSGDIAVPEGAPVADQFTIILDGSAVAANTTFSAFLFDGSQIHANTCSSCPGTVETVDAVIGSEDCNAYASLLQILCSSPHLITGVEVAVYNSGATPYLPKTIKWSRKNIKGEGPNGVIDVMEDKTVYPRPGEKFAVVSLVNAAARIDNQTRWAIENIPGGNRLELRFFVTAAKSN